MLALLGRRSVVLAVLAAVWLLAVGALLRLEGQQRSAADQLFERVAESTATSVDSWLGEVLRGQREAVFALQSETGDVDDQTRLSQLLTSSPAAFAMWLDGDGQLVAAMPARADLAPGTSMLGSFSHIDAVYAGTTDTAVWSTDAAGTSSGRVLAVVTRVSPGGPAVSTAFDLADTGLVDIAEAATSVLGGARVHLVDPSTGIDVLAGRDGAATSPPAADVVSTSATVAEGLLTLEVAAPTAAVEAAVGGVTHPLGRGFLAATGLLFVVVGLTLPGGVQRLAARRRSARRTASLLELAPMAALVVAPDGRIERVNDAMCRLTGWSTKELAGRAALGDLVDADVDDGVAARLSAAAAGTAPPVTVEAPVRVATRDGAGVAARMMISAGTASDGSPLGMVLQVVDMRAELRTRDALDRARHEAAQFSARVAHDLLNPLVAASGLASTLRDFELPDEQEALVHERVAASLQAATELVRRLADTARRVGDEPWEPVDLREVVERLRALMAGALAQTGGTLELDALRPEVVLPSDTIATVLANLVDNALKYRRDGVPPRIVLRTQRDPGRVHLIVEDNGRGVGPDELDLIFDAGHQVDSGSIGQGHGLAECRRLVELVGGTIHAQAATGGGLAFHVVLPQHAPTPPTAATQAAAHADRAQLPSG